jgi:UDP-GlcNAc:undecaprenyl-phosphate GlcNAc-1-phosphate transferase
MNNSLFIFIIIFFNCFFIFFLRKLQNKINIFDEPDGFRKLQKRAIPPIGGFIICFNVILIFFILIVNNNLFLFEYSYFYENNKIILRSFFSFFLTSIILFIIGLYDDKLNIKPLLKVFLLSLIYFSTILVDEKLIIENLIFFSFNKIIYLNKFSFIFTVLCFLFLVNAFNLYDGINLQSSIYFCSVYLFFYIENIFPSFSLIFLISNLFFLYLNSRNLMFYGDNGIFINSYIISYFLIIDYKYNPIENLKSDEILLMFFLPTIEVIRLFFSRVLQLKNPFIGDRNHLHHLLIDSIKNIYITNIILFIFIIIPFIFIFFKSVVLLEFYLLYIILYVFLILILKLLLLEKNKS